MTPNIKSRATQALCFGAAAVSLVLSSVIAPAQQLAQASSHREAPLIAQDQFADTTDVYAFVSPDRPDSVTLIGSWIPFEGPQGGPNYYKFADDVLYTINVDNDGDAKPNVTYNLKFTSKIANPATFLYNTGPIESLDSANWNQKQTYQIDEVINGKSTTIASGLTVPPVNIGPKSTPNYDKLFEAGINTVKSADGDIKVFAGQTDDPFWVDLLVFDLLSLRPQKAPIGYPTGPSKGVDGLKGFNVHSVALQVPIKHLLTGSKDTVIGVWATSSRPTTKVYSAGGVEAKGDQVQISRLGMPLVNEAVLPLALKDAFNGLKPEQDFGLFTSNTPAGNLLASSVLTPELGTLLNALYKVPAPGKPRNDLVSIFLTGMKTATDFTLVTAKGKVTVPAGTNVNQPANVQPAEMLRLNTAEPFRPGVAGSLCAPKPNYKLGLLGGDVCGFPNGRRLQDDVTDIELLAVAGAAYTPLTGDKFDFNAGLIPVLSDGVDANDKPFRASFPYLAVPHQGYNFRSCANWGYGPC